MEVVATSVANSVVGPSALFLSIVTLRVLTSLRQTSKGVPTHTDTDTDTDTDQNTKVTDSPEYLRLLERCESERRGRINTEIKFRKYQREQHDSSASSSSTSNSISNDTLSMTPIAYITTPFTKRTGCPRQPTLCPHSIATINLQKDCHPDTIQGLEQYSHCWVIFTFDNNTDVRTHKNNYKAKITPPRIRPAGTKVGCMSTRTPHRPNNVGLSLLTIKSVSGRTITVSGVDLCDQTPIYDIKPYVPWDVAGYISGGRWGGEMCGVVQCPDWVWDPEALEYIQRTSNGSNGYGSPRNKIKTEEIVRIENVTWTDEAVEQLTREHQKGTFKPLYPSRKSDVNTVRLAISEILSQDPRHNRQKGTATNEEGYKVVFCAAQVRFVVGDDKKTEVVEISKVNFEEGDGDGRMKLFKK